MTELREVSSKDYLIKNGSSMCIYCKDNVKNVRHYLEHECGFKHASWETDKHLNLTCLYVRNDGYVHGGSYLIGKVGGRVNVSISNLLNQYEESLGYKPIKLTKD